jgi:shikimate kinase
MLAGMSDGAGASRNVFLVGPMGSGKTAVGKQLARLFGLPFVDSDAEVERRTGVDIPLIFDKEGEAGFRVRERDAIADLAAREGIVLSTGGGAVLLAENRALLRGCGTTVYLETSVAQQAARVRRGDKRPLIAGAADPAARLADLMAHRAPLYAEVAAVTVRTDGSPLKDVVRRVVEGLRTCGYPLPPAADRILAP